LIAGADDLIQKVEFLSVYDLGEKKSLAVRIEYAAKDRTLTSEEVAVIEKNIIKLVEQKLKGNLRG
jgi:phenylalanyl-tRNA synthetase beta subunit